MALQTAQTNSTETQEIGRHNRENLLKQANDDNVLFALQNNKKKASDLMLKGQAESPALDDSDEDEDEEMGQLVSGAGKKGKWNAKSHISQSQIDEKKRQQLDQILDDIRMKYERKQL